jgi:hypothetical protein
MFAVFPSLSDFNLWHDNIKDKLNYPIIGKNALTGENDLTNLTTEYTKPLTIEEDTRVVCWVGDEAEGLQLIDRYDAEYKVWFDTLTSPFYLLAQSSEIVLGG